MQASAMTVSLGVIFATSCATGGTGPHEQSAAAHEQAALKAEQAAAAEEAQVQSNPQSRCGREHSAGTNSGANSSPSPCWTPSSNKAHLEDAERQRKAAAAHRKGSAALQQAESAACAGIDPADRDISPFFHREDIVRVEPETAGGSRAGSGAGKDLPSRAVVGATVYFRAVEGLTAEWLQRTINCHLARNAVLGHDVPEMDYCPLVPKGVTATVSPSGDTLAVTIVAQDPNSSAEVLRRANALIEGRDAHSSDSGR